MGFLFIWNYIKNYFMFGGKSVSLHLKLDNTKVGNE